MKNNTNSSTICHSRHSFRHPELNSASCRLLSKEKSRIKYGMTLFTNNAAFSLIELLVVVLIIGILAAVALPKYQLAVAKARYMQLIALANALHKGQQIHKFANDSY